MLLRLIEHIAVVPSPQSQSGFEYKVASGAAIANTGMRRLDAVAINDPDTLERIHLQVPDVHKCLPSVTKCADI